MCEMNFVPIFQLNYLNFGKLEVQIMKIFPASLLFLQYIVRKFYQFERLVTYIKFSTNISLSLTSSMAKVVRYKF